MKTGRIMAGVYFICDRCGKEYTFSQAYLTVLKGESYFDPRDGQEYIASCDLCRDCSGQNARFVPGVQVQLNKEIAAIDASTEALLVKDLS